MNLQQTRRVAAIAAALLTTALFAPVQSRGQDSAEQEEQLREALQKKREPKLLLDLGAVLIERADALDPASELGQSLRLGILEEALEDYVEAQKAPECAADGAIGASRCQTLLGRDGSAEATLRAALARLRESAASLDDRRRVVREQVLFLALRDRREEARAAIEAAKAAGDLDEGGVALEELRLAATRGEQERVLPLALAAIGAKADSFDVAWICWDAYIDPKLAPAQDGARLEKLLHVYSKLLERKTGDVALLYYRGVTRHYMRDGAGALGDLGPCRDDARLGKRAQLFYGRALISLRRAEEALPIFDRLLEDEATKAETLNGIIGVAVLRATGRDFAGALELYRRVLAADPASLWARIGEPLCLRSMGRLDEAASAYEAGLRVLRDEPQLLNDYALLLKARGERAKAKEYFERALGAGSADGGENLGIIAFRDERDRKEAARYFARTLLLDPNRARVRFYRELCLCDGGS